MAHNINPLTGNENVDPTELPGGEVVYFDKDDGLLYGDADLPSGISADKFFESKYGTPRPGDYRATLQAVADEVEDPDSKTPSLHVGAAKGVLDGTMQVFVTSAKVRDMRKEIGLSPQAQNVGAVRLHPDTIRISDLGTGNTDGALAQTQLNGHAAARQTGDAASLTVRRRNAGPTGTAEPSSGSTGNTADATGTASLTAAEAPNTLTPPTEAEIVAARAQLSAKSDDELREIGKDYQIADADALAPDVLIEDILVASGYGPALVAA